MSTDLEEIKDETEELEEEKPVVYDDITKWNAKVVTPVIVLTATLFIAVYTYFKHYPVGVWIRILVLCVCIFLVMGSIVERMITRFVDINYDKAVAERREAEKLEEEARAAMEAEALLNAAQEAQQGSQIIQDEDIPTQF